MYYQNKKPVVFRKAKGYRGNLLFKHWSISEDEQAIVNKQIKLITSSVYDTKLSIEAL